jgi:two-component system, cell cycle sensor histidine kinase and response regulator CckA
MELSSPAPCLSQIALPLAPRTHTALDWPVQVLLVEDSAEAAWLVQACLKGPKGDQFRVEWTDTVLDAMTRLALPGIEVVLLDLGLPELNGYRSFHAIDAAANGKVPVVILTSDDRTVSRDLTVGFGASDYLIKGRISPVQLRESLLNAIRQGRPQLH